MSFGTRMRERRESLGLKQSELGELLGITGSAIGNYEKGVSSPKADILYRVFDVLKCDANYLFQDEMQELRDDSFSITEVETIKKYRTLDEHGIEVVNAVLEIEYLRCSGHSAPRLRAARGGGVNSEPLPIEYVEDCDTSDLKN